MTKHSYNITLLNIISAKTLHIKIDLVFSNNLHILIRITGIIYAIGKLFESLYSLSNELFSIVYGGQPDHLRFF